MTLTVGDSAPAIKLPAAPGEEVDVGGLLGREKVVLLFFPLAYSPVCTTEMCTLARDWRDWEALGARVFGLSVDSPFVTSKFRSDYDIPFPILSDFNRTAARDYDVLHENLRGLEGVSKRAVFVIDTSGRIAYRWVTDDPSVEPDYETVRVATETAT